MGNALQVTFDATDPARQAAFWSLALGYVDQAPPPGFDSWEAFGASHGVEGARGPVVDPDGAGPRLLFQQVPESKTAKNRMHLDVHAPGESNGDRRAVIDAHVVQLVEAGATRLGDREQFGVFWVVLQDPEGNEFCIN